MADGNWYMADVNKVSIAKLDVVKESGKRVTVAERCSETNYNLNINKSEPGLHPSFPAAKQYLISRCNARLELAREKVKHAEEMLLKANACKEVL